MIDFSVFTTADAWITLVTLMFLEIVLGVDNIVFISLTTDRLPKEKQHIGRIAGLAGAFVMRSLFLAVASWLTHMTDPLFSIDLGFWAHGFSVRDIILFLGGAYLIYSGISELVSVLALEEVKDEHENGEGGKKKIGLVQAVATIMVMDIVFSIDSVITAVGLANSLIIMIMAVLFAIILMMVFIDTIANFINAHVEIKILALVFIAVIGFLLFFDSLSITTGIEVIGMSLEKIMVYFAMVFSIVIVLIQMKYNSNFAKFEQERKAEAEKLEAEDAFKKAEPDALRKEAQAEADALSEQPLN